MKLSMSLLFAAASMVLAALFLWMLTLFGQMIYFYIGMLLTLAVLLIFGRVNILDPRVWLGVAAFLYGTAASLLNDLGVQRLYFPIDSALVIFVAYLFLAIGLLSASALLPTTREVFLLQSWQQSREHNDAFSRVEAFVIPFFWVVTLMVIINNFAFFFSGATTKRDFWEFRDDVFYMTAFYNLWIICYAMVILRQIKFGRLRVPMLFAGFCLILAVITMINTGERDVIIKLIVASVFLAVFTYRKGAPAAIFALFLTILALPFTKDLGTSLHTGVEFRARDSLTIAILENDFNAAGRNLDMLMYNPAIYREIGTERLFADVARGLVPGQFFQFENTGTWFTRHYTPYVTGRDRAGIGFSLFGAFFIYGGFVATAVGFSLIGAMSALFWHLAKQSRLMFAGYCLLAPLFIWSLRGDLAYVLSGAIKQVFLPLLFLWIFGLLLKALRSGQHSFKYVTRLETGRRTS